MKAEYVDHMGDDLLVVNAARVSFDKESLWEDDTEFTLFERDVKLIKYLCRHGHWTPFSHPMITVRETVPIFVARQRFKHMVGFTYNEVSRRYVDDEPEFFMPDHWRRRPDGSVKQGSSDEVAFDMNYSFFTNAESAQCYQHIIEDAKGLYLEMVGRGVAPEQARMVLPQSMYTSYYVTGSLAAWARAYKQRIDSHAQVEIQDLAKQWDEVVRPLFPVSWEALTA